jgi:hypothetical protein
VSRNAQLLWNKTKILISTEISYSVLGNSASLHNMTQASWDLSAEHRLARNVADAATRPPVKLSERQSLQHTACFDRHALLQEFASVPVHAPVYAVLPVVLCRDKEHSAQAYHGLYM